MGSTAKSAKAWVSIPSDLLQKIDELAGKRKRSQFIAEATRKELSRLKLEGALDAAAGAWKDGEHPELVQLGTYQWVRNLRTSPAGKTEPD